MISKVLNRVRTAVGLTLVPGARTALVWNRFALEAVKRAHEDRAKEARNAGVGLARLARRLKKAKEETTRLKKENDALIAALAAYQSAAVEVIAIEEDVTRAPADHAAIYPPPIEYDLDEIDNGPVF
jgi:hypothetical protein